MNVAFRAAKEYELTQVQPLIDDLLQPISHLMMAGKTAVLKVNLLMKAAPERAITTHPVVVEAVANHLIDRGMNVIIADSPGGPFIAPVLDSIYRASGLAGVAERTGALLNHDLSSSETLLDGAEKLHRFEILNVVKQADLVINLPKCKTHGMMTYTGAVKNLFGVIPGLTKANHHFRLPSRLDFGDHLVDIAEFVQADFHLMDGIVGMEGDGPSGGQLIQSGFLAASLSAHHLDRAICQLIGIEEKLVPTLLAAIRRGLLNEQTQVIGDTLRVKPFVLPKSAPVTFLPSWVPEGLHHRLAKAIRSKPDFLHKKCIGCAKCAEICPAQVITMNQDRRPECDYDNCISCFCCHEICPVKAIEIKQSFLGSLLKK